MHEEMLDLVELDCLQAWYDILETASHWRNRGVRLTATIADIKALPKSRRRSQFVLDGPPFAHCILLFSLPRRLFDSLTPAQADGSRVVEPNLPLIAAMLDCDADINAHEGLALNRAVEVQHIPLLKLLHSKWNGVFSHSGQALRTAIRLNNAQIVRLLLHGVFLEEGNPSLEKLANQINSRQWEGYWDELVAYARDEGTGEMIVLLQEEYRMSLRA